MELLQEFNFEIRYKPGRENTVADALSRATHQSQLNAITGVNFDEAFQAELKQAYLEDKLCRDLIQAEQRPPDIRWDRVRLWKHIGGDWKWWVPQGKGIREKILAECHDADTAGHLGRHKTLQRVRFKYYWPRVTTETERYVSTCISCQRNKASHRRPLGLLQPLPLPDERWMEVTMDFMGPLPRTSREANCMLVVVDRFSKMLHLLATQTTASAQDVAELYFSQIFRLLGLPKAIITDRDTKFTGGFWTALWKKTGTRLAMSSGYHPQTDGQTERANRTIEQMLRSYVSAEGSNWDLKLTAVEFAYNSAVHSSTRFSPFYLVYGMNPRTPHELLADSNSPPADD